jgi:LacI family transcriptional regulator
MDVAREAGVSIRTVSRVINGSPKVGGDTREAIQTVIDRLGFRPSMRGRALANGRSYLLGVVQDDPNAHVIGLFQRGIVEASADRGYELLVHPVRANAKVTDELIGFVQRTHVDGLILLPPISENPAVPVALSKLGVPAVAIAAVRVPAYPAMLISEERLATDAVAEYLVGLGHRRLSIITGPLNHYSSTEREQGFRAGLARANITLPRSHVVEGDYGFASGVAAAEQLLSLPQRPTAIFACNDIMAAGVLKVASERGIHVPSALSVVGFDDSDIASMLSPALTTIRRPLSDMAHEATSRLMDMIDTGPDERLPDHRVGLTLVERQSTGPAPDPA